MSKKKKSKSDKSHQVSKKSSRKKSVNRSRNRESIEEISVAKKSLIILGDFLFYGLMLLILVGAVFFKFSDSPTKSLYGYNFMTVKTGSMAPNKNKPELTDGFPAGSLIVVKKVDPNSLKVGDIITFFPVPDNTDAYLTHRIISTDTPIGEGENAKVGITTQGDANDGPDFPIEKSAVVGKVVWSVKGFGNMIDFIRDKYIIVLSFIVMIIAFIWSLKYYLSIPNQVEKKDARKGKQSKTKRKSQRKVKTNH